MVFRVVRTFKERMKCPSPTNQSLIALSNAILVQFLVLSTTAYRTFMKILRKPFQFSLFEKYC